MRGSKCKNHYLPSSKSCVVLSASRRTPGPTFMETTTESPSAIENVVIEKTRELCQTILNQPEYETIRKQVDAFFDDEQAQAAYQELSSKGEYLQHKQAQSLP